MKPKWGTWLAILMVVSMILSACAAPQSTDARSLSVA